MALRNVSKAWLISFIRVRSRALAVFRRYLLNGAGFCFGFGVLFTCFFCSTSMRFWMDLGRRLYFSGIWMCSFMSLHLKLELTLTLRPKDGPFATVAMLTAYGSLRPFCLGTAPVLWGLSRNLPVLWGWPLSFGKQSLSWIGTITKYSRTTNHYCSPLRACGVAQQSYPHLYFSTSNCQLKLNKWSLFVFVFFFRMNFNQHSTHARCSYLINSNSERIRFWWATAFELLSITVTRRKCYFPVNIRYISVALTTQR